MTELLKNIHQIANEPWRTFVTVALILGATMYVTVKFIKELQSIDLNPFDKLNKDKRLLKQICEIDGTMKLFPENESLPFAQEQKHYRYELAVRHASKSFTNYVKQQLKSPAKNNSNDIRSAFQLQGQMAVFANSMLYFGCSSFIACLLIFLSMSLPQKTDSAYHPLVLVTLGPVIFLLSAFIYSMIKNTWESTLINTGFNDLIHKEIDSHGFEGLGEDYEEKAFLEMVEHPKIAIRQPQWRYHISGAFIGTLFPVNALALKLQESTKAAPPFIQNLLSAVVIVYLICVMLSNVYLAVIIVKEEVAYSRKRREKN